MRYPLVAARSASMLLRSCASAVLRFYGPVLLCCIHVNAVLQATPRHRDAQVL
jgi:hypothetical protein